MWTRDEYASRQGYHRLKLPLPLVCRRFGKPLLGTCWLAGKIATSNSAQGTMCSARATVEERYRRHYGSDEDTFRQSVLVPLMNGVFQSEDPGKAFLAVIRANKVQMNAQGNRALNGFIHLGPQSPWQIRSGIRTGCRILVLAGLFLAFTGRKTKWRNQTAIFSEDCHQCFWLYRSSHRCPRSRYFPTAMWRKMIGAPAGLSQYPHAESGRGSDGSSPLNTGGFSYEALAEPKPATEGTGSTGRVGATEGGYPAPQELGPLRRVGTSDGEPSRCGI